MKTLQGKQESRQCLKDVNIDEMVIGKLDVDQFALEEDMTFTFGDADLLDAFDEL